MDESSGRPMAARGAAWRRRQRRLRSMLRHERQTVAMELAAALHHSRDVGSGKNDGLRAQKTVNSREDAVFFELFDEDTAGTRPDRLSDVRPQEQVQRHNVGQVVDAVPGLPALDVPVPLKVEQLADVLSLIAQYEREMDRLEDRILQGSPVSTADREAWRRWVDNSSSSRIEEEEKEEEEEEAAESRLAASSWSRWLPCPLLCDDRFWGARGVPAPQTMDFVEEIPLVRVFVEQIVVCQCHRSWRFSSCRRSRRKSWR